MATAKISSEVIMNPGQTANIDAHNGPVKKQVGVPLCLKRKFATSYKCSKCRLDARMQTSSAKHDLAAHLGCDGDKDIDEYAFYITDVVIQFQDHFSSLVSRACT